MIQQKKKLSKYLLISALIHILIGLLISQIYAQPPQARRTLKIIGTIKLQDKEPEPPPPKPRMVAKTEATKKAVPKKKERPKPAPQKVTPPKVTQQPVVKDPLQSQPAAEKAPEKSRSDSGVPGLKGTRGAPGDRPGMRASGGIVNPTLETKIGGTGLTPGISHGTMKLPAGTGRIPGAGGKDLAGFRLGSQPTGTGVGSVDIDGRGGSGGTRGRADDGPGAGVANTGRIGVGAGKGTTGIGVGATEGMGELDSEPGGTGTGGGGTGPGGLGSSGYSPTGVRGTPGVATNPPGYASRNSQVSPTRRDIPDNEKLTSAPGKKEFQADVGKDMTTAPQPIEKPANRGYENALQLEINKNLYSLRKMHEDWTNLEIPNIPKALQITIDLDGKNGKASILKLDFHNPSLENKVVNDLTSKIKSWKFDSLFDGKNDPEKWPIKLSGKVSWQ